MIHSRGNRSSRQAFTLIEMLIVIAIIATLAAILLGAVVTVLIVREKTQTQFEIQKMTESLNTAKAAFPGKPTWLPSQLLLYNTLSNYTTDNSALSQQSRSALGKIFGPRLFKNGSTVNWDGSGKATAKNTLQGHQCLVFWLGGATTTSASGTPGCLGFSVNPTDPMASGGQRLGPFFDFKPNQLKSESNGFFSYQDPYLTGQPYAYFSTFGSENKYSNTDCAALSVQPYTVSGSSPPQFFNASSFQIISAGKDGVFGNLGTWDPTNGSTDSSTKDDLTNFSKGQLGTTQS